LDKILIRQIPWLFWALAICILSLVPGDQLPNYQFDIISIDTLAHLIMYSVFAFLQLYAFSPRENEQKNKMNGSSLRLYGYVILIGISFGLVIELIQGNYIYRRYFDIYDLWANFFGTIFGGFIFRLIGIKFIKI